MNVNTELKNSSVGSQYGSPMGRSNHCDNENATVTLQQVIMIDGDYDAGGAYWGGGSPLWCAMDEEGEVQVFVRATCFEHASMKVLSEYPGLTIKKQSEIDLDLFVSAYVEAMLWASTTDDGEPMDDIYSIDDLAPETLESITADCKAFIEENHDDILTWDGRYPTEDMAGHDFFLTRNGHGCGFWDGDWDREVGARLTKSSKTFGESDPYIGDNGLIYV